jgi:protein tyrosine phosphatase (PTP) superfamily phosphohydrolase (DUF442 family)
MKKRNGLPLALVLVASLGTSIAAPAPAVRPASWAAAVTKSGVDNLYRIEDDLYRSAQPTADGLKELASMGVKAVLDLKGDGDNFSGGSLKLLHVPMTAFGLRDDKVVAALKILADPQNRPIVVHCQHGADRTGAIVALYRVVVQGWTKDEAIREMNQGGYRHNALFSNLDRYVERADIAALRKALGITAPAASLAAKSPVLATAAQAVVTPTILSASAAK